MAAALARSAEKRFWAATLVSRRYAHGQAPRRGWQRAYATRTQCQTANPQQPAACLLSLACYGSGLESAENAVCKLTGRPGRLLTELVRLRLLLACMYQSLLLGLVLMCS
eukprot:357464-Chlamydomonas_euryale.AAC.3